MAGTHQVLPLGTLCMLLSLITFRWEGCSNRLETATIYMYQPLIYQPLHYVWSTMHGQLHRCLTLWQYQVLTHDHLSPRHENYKAKTDHFISFIKVGKSIEESQVGAITEPSLLYYSGYRMYYTCSMANFTECACSAGICCSTSHGVLNNCSDQPTRRGKLHLSQIVHQYEYNIRRMCR